MEAHSHTVVLKDLNKSVWVVGMRCDCCFRMCQMHQPHILNRQHSERCSWDILDSIIRSYSGRSYAVSSTVKASPVATVLGDDEDAVVFVMKVGVSVFWLSRNYTAVTENLLIFRPFFCFELKRRRQYEIIIWEQYSTKGHSNARASSTWNCCRWIRRGEQFYQHQRIGSTRTRGRIASIILFICYGCVWNANGSCMYKQRV